MHSWRLLPASVLAAAAVLAAFGVLSAQPGGGTKYALLVGVNE